MAKVAEVRVLAAAPREKLLPGSRLGNPALKAFFPGRGPPEGGMKFIGVGGFMFAHIIFQNFREQLYYVTE